MRKCTLVKVQPLHELTSVTDERCLSVKPPTVLSVVGNVARILSYP